MAADALHTLSIRDLARRLDTGQVTSAALVSAFLERIESVDPGIQAWTVVAAASALDAARARDRDRAEGKARGPMFGIPVGIKDVFDTRGIPTSYGSTLFAGHVPPTSAAAVVRLENAGAIVLGKTATSEFAALDPAPTRNPRNTGHTPGGSSSGSAAAVAAGMCPAAIGTQTAGSIGRPAAFCGVVGAMPTQSRIPRTGLFPAAWSLDHVGAFARSVEDVRLVIEALAGEALVGEALVGEDFREDSGPELEIGTLGEYFRDHAIPEAWEQHETFLDRLRETPGIRVRDVALPPGFDASVAALWTIMKSELAAVHRERHAEHRSEMGARIGALIEEGLRIRATEYLAALETRREFQAAMPALFSGVDVLVSPGATGPAPEGLGSTGDPAMNAPWTLADLPTVSLPTHSSGAGLPLGVQISAPALGESVLFSHAARIERIARA